MIKVSLNPKNVVARQVKPLPLHQTAQWGHPEHRKTCAWWGKGAKMDALPHDRNGGVKKLPQDSQRLTV